MMAGQIGIGRGGIAGGTGAAAISVSEGHCINLRGRQEACDLCPRACPARAISLTLDEVSVDPALCVGCGACVPACPAGALVRDGFDPGDFVAALAGDPVVRIGCVQAAAAEGMYSIPCLRMLDARILAALLAEGVRRIELAGTGSCADCPSGGARRDLAAARRRLKTWLGENGPEVVLVDGVGPDGGAGDAPARAAERRRLLKGVFSSLLDGEPAAVGDGAGALPGFDALIEDADDALQEARARPVPCQQVLASRRRALPFREGGPVGATGRVIAESCTGCLVCADLCPTGALRGETGAGRTLVSFDPEPCTNCTLCLKVCPVGAISGHALRGVEAALAGRQVLFVRRDRICSICGNVFGEESGMEQAICPPCRNECEMDDEWREMLSG